MRRENAKEAIVTAAGRYLPALAENLQFDLVLEQKELTVELGGHKTSDFEELATGQWDIHTPPYTTQYRFIGCGPKFGDKVIVTSREYDYTKRLGEVDGVFEKIIFTVPSAPTDAVFCMEFKHENLEWKLLRQEKSKDYYYVSVSCKGMFKARAVVMCDFEIEVDEEEAHGLAETLISAS